MNIGDNVLSQRNVQICTILDIRPECHFVLTPMTKRGYPSVDQTKWQYCKISEMVKLTGAKKYPKLYICPKCGVNDKPFRQNMLLYPLRRLSAYDDKYQCKRCKEIIVRNG